MPAIKFSQLSTLNTLQSGTILPVVYNGTNYKLTVDLLKGYVTPVWSEVRNKPTFAEIAFSGDYAVLVNKPAIPTKVSQLEIDVDLGDTAVWTSIIGKPTFATVATSGSYADLINKPNLTVYVTATGLTSILSSYTTQTYVTSQGYITTSSLTWNNITGKPAFATVSTSGSYTHLTNTPILATVATSGRYGDLSDKPLNLSNFNNDIGAGGGGISTATVTALIANSLTNNLATVARTGNWTDVVNKPAWFMTTATGYLYSDGTGTLNFQPDSSLIQSATTPVGNTSTLWYDTVGGRSYVYYDSGWVDASPMPVVDTTQLTNNGYSLSLDSAGVVNLPTFSGSPSIAIVQTASAGIGLNANGTYFNFNQNGQISGGGGINNSIDLSRDITISSGKNVRINPGSGGVVSDKYWTFGSDGVILPNLASIVTVDIGFRATFPSNGPGGTSSNNNSLTVGIANPVWADAILANPGGHYIKFNWDDYQTEFPISGISGPAPGTNVYTLTGTWTADGGAFPIVISSNNYVAGITKIVSDNGTQIATTGGTWTFAADGNLTLAGGNVFFSNAPDSTVMYNNGISVSSGTQYATGVEGNTAGINQYWFADGTIPTRKWAAVRVNSPENASTGSVVVSTGAFNSRNNWIFAHDGSTVLPENTLKGYCFTATNSVFNYLPQAAQFLYTDNPILQSIATIGGTWYIKGPGLVGWKTITGVQDNGGVALIVRIGGGNTPLPDGSEFNSSGHNPTSPDLVYTISQYLELDVKAADKTWTFSSTGTITFPDATVQTTAFTASSYINIADLKAIITTCTNFTEFKDAILGL